MYLYVAEGHPKKKLAIKVENISQRNGTAITNESYYLRILNELGCDRVIEYYGDGFCFNA